MAFDHVTFKEHYFVGVTTVPSLATIKQRGLKILKGQNDQQVQYNIHDPSLSFEKGGGELVQSRLSIKGCALEVSINKNSFV